MGKIDITAIILGLITAGTSIAGFIYKPEKKTTSEIVAALQRDLDDAYEEIEKLKTQVDFLLSILHKKE